jgi:signal peptidase I
MNTEKLSLIRRILIGERPRRTLRVALLLALFTFVVCRYVVLPVRVQGLSMEPTFRNRSIHLAYMLAYAKKEPQRGDIVLISMSGRGSMYMKRVLALPGERISFMGGQLFINGKPIDEVYLKERGSWTMPEMSLRQDEYFVAGDNRSVDISYHTLGSVYRSDILSGILF